MQPLFPKEFNYDEYIYLGDKLSRTGQYAGKNCIAVRRADGKCIRGKNGNMLVQFEGGQKVVVLARQLRKQKSHKVEP
jgi:hypothetical protein